MVTTRMGAETAITMYARTSVMMRVQEQAVQCSNEDDSTSTTIEKIVDGNTSQECGWDNANRAE